MLNKYYEARSSIVEALRRDLMGPSDEKEVIEDLPATQYIVGILFPSSRADFPDEENTQEHFGDEGDDSPVALANLKFPSSMGLTFSVDASLTDVVVVQIETARYERTNTAGNNDSTAGWRRVPQGPVSERIILNGAFTQRRPTEIPGLDLFVRVRPHQGSTLVTVTLVLINALPAIGNGQEARDTAAFYQTKLSVTGLDADVAVFVERPRIKTGVDDSDLRVYELIYRNSREFAAGHGCSAEWTVDAGSERAKCVQTEYIPEFRLRLSDSNPEIDTSELSMLKLATSERTQVCSDLSNLCDSYDDWIVAKKHSLERDDEFQTFVDVGQENLQLCLAALSRIRNGITLLQRNDDAWRAFVLMNRAMLTQRARSQWIKAGRPTEGPADDASHVWRPFQIAFILMCLAGISEPQHFSEEREIVDLLWFPTGGGKTEAYLGLIAFTIFHRRLTKEDGGGLTAFMRYTLRLLTIQQFERAAILICACEAIRKADADSLGTETISIGLWLGQDSTPNSIADARTAINKLMRGEIVEKGNPMQIQACVWCGHPLTARNYWIIQDNSAMVVSCRQSDCDFKNGLPVTLIDEQVYKSRPSLLIATADKFASLPWNDQTRALFNLATPGRPRQMPPELIIQDELHLISGPLGSLAGLYETAIDSLSSDGPTRPKVIASTATIRRADSQTKAIFGRRMAQFPPPGLDAGDSYFSSESDPVKKGDRMYVGLMSPSASHTTLLVRTYAALLQASKELQIDEDVLDQYWSLVGYFNSLRVLGGARMQVQDDVGDRIELLSTRHETEPRKIEQVVELTSRVPASQIPQHLNQISTPVPDENVVDVVLATNMISVGVDIDRLGLMAVMGQPQSTSEYIQSTSRVGRRFPGLVVTMYNAARSRDRSHYESFRRYHSALYRQVESTSVTPFSPRARDRALHAVVIALCRLSIRELMNNDDAGNAGQIEGAREQIREIVKKRVEYVDGRELAETLADVDDIFDFWLEMAAESTSLRYSRWGETTGVLLSEADGAQTETSFPTLRSLRDVDQDSNLYYVKEAIG